MDTYSLSKGMKSPIRLTSEKPPLLASNSKYKITLSTDKGLKRGINHTRNSNTAKSRSQKRYSSQQKGKDSKNVKVADAIKELKSKIRHNQASTISHSRIESPFRTYKDHSEASFSTYCMKDKLTHLNSGYEYKERNSLLS